MKKKIIILILILITAIGGGVGAYILTSANKAPAEIEDTEAKYKTTLKEAPTDGSTPDKYSALDNVAFALWKIENTNEFSTTTYGKSEASVATIEIFGKRVVKDGKAISSSVSSGLVSSGKEKYFINGKVLIRDANRINGFDTTWKTDTPECITNNAYMKRYGWLPYQCTGYIICEETILSTSDVINNGDGTYSLDLDLNPGSEFAPFWYRREVLTNSGSTIEPEFKSIKISYKFDSNWRVLESRIQEEYKVVSMGIAATSKTDCTETFNYENVQFEENSYSFFKQYENLAPADGDVEVKTDVLTMITSSLQNADGSDKTLDVSIKINDNELAGLVSLNISDLQNVKVKALLDDLYVEYGDSLYISLGGLKVKGKIDDITDLISILTNATGKSDNVEENSNQIDASQIISDINNAELTYNDDETEITALAKINLLGIEIPLNFKFSHINDTYSLISANVNLTIDDIAIEVNASEATSTIPTIDTADFMEIKNIDYIVKSIAEVLESKKMTVNLSTKYDNININGDVRLDFNDEIRADVDINISYNEKSLQLNLKYLNETIYLNFENIYLKLTIEDLKLLIEKYGNDSITIDNDFNLNQIIKALLELDYNKLLKKVELNESETEIVVGLKELNDKLTDLKLLISKDENLSLSVIYDSLVLNATIIPTIEKEIEVQDDLYSNLKYIDFIIDSALDIYKNKQVVINLEAKYEEITINVDAEIDFVNELKLHAIVTLSNSENSQTIDLYFVGDIVYVSLANINLKITIDDLKTLLNKFGVEIDINTASDVSISGIINTILSIDFNELIKSLVINEDNVSLEVDLSQFTDLISEITATISKNENGLDVSLSLFDITGSIEAKEVSVEVDESKYQDLANVGFIIDSALDIYKNKQVAIKLEAKYEEITINVDAEIDFVNELKLHAIVILSNSENSQTIDLYFVGDIVYVSLANINLKITIDDLKTLLNKFGVEIDINTASDVSISGIINTILSIDFNELIKSLVISEDNVSLEVDLSQFTDLISEITATISKNENGLDVSLSLFDITGSIKVKEVSVEVPELDYQDLKFIDFVVDDVLTIINNKSLSANIEATIKDILVSAIIDIDYNNGLKFSANVNLLCDDKNYNILLHYLSINNDGAFYLDYNDLHISASLSEILDLIPNKDSDQLSSSDIVKAILSIDFDKLLNNLKLSSGNISFDLDLSDYSTKLQDLIDLTKKISVAITDNDGKLNISTSLLDLSITISNLNNEIKIDDVDYTDLSVLISNVKYFVDNFKNESFSFELENGQIEIVLNDKKYQVNLNGHVDLLLNDNSKYEISGAINVDGLGVELSIELYLDINNNLYIKMLNQTFKFELAEIDSFINNLTDKISSLTGKDLNSNVEIKTSDVLGILDSISISDNSINMSLTELIGKSCLIALEYNSVLDNSLSFKLGVDFDSIVNMNFDVKTSIIDRYDISYPQNYLTQDDILTIVDYAIAAVNTIKNNYIYFDFGFNIEEDGVNLFDFTGNIQLHMIDLNKDVPSFDAYLNLTIQEYDETGAARQLHTLELTILSMETLCDESGMFYAAYGNGEGTNSPSNTLKIKSKYTGIVDLVTEIIEFVKSPAIKKLLGNLISTSSSNENISLNKLISYLTVNDSNLSIGIDAKTLFNEMNESNVIEGSIYKYSDMLDSINLNNVIVAYDDYKTYTKLNNIRIDFYNKKNDSDLSIEDKINIKTPSDANDYKYDITNLHYLIESLSNTAQQTEFEIEGSVTLSVLSIINPNVGINAKIRVNDDSTFDAHVRLDVPRVNTIVYGTLTKKTVDIYYHNEYVYINRLDSNGDSYKVKIHYTTFMDDIVYYLLKYAIGLPDGIYSMIVNSEESEKTFVDASKCITNIELTQYLYTFGFDLSVLAGNSNLGEMKVSLAASEIAVGTDENGNSITKPLISSIPNFSVNLVSVIDIKSSDLKLKNFKSTGVESIDMTSFDNYISSSIDTNQEVDMKYEGKNNSNWNKVGKISHSLIFEMGIIDNISYEYVEGDNINLPNVKNIVCVDDEYGKHYYKFIGFYMDSKLKTPYTEMVMPAKKTYIYAKWQDVTVRINVEASDNNDAFTYTTYVGASLDEFYSILTTITIDNKMYKVDYYLNNELFNNDTIDTDITLKPVWNEAKMYANYNGESIELDNNNTSTLFSSGKYMVGTDEMYYLIDYTNLTSTNLLTNYYQLFKNCIINIYDYSKLDGYYTLTFDTVKSEFNNKNYYGLQIKNDVSFDSDLLPNTTYETYEINAWVDSYNNYYRLSDLNKAFNEDTSLTAYITTNRKYFKYEGQTITGFNTDDYKDITSSITTLILPRYNVLDNVITVVGDSAFEGNKDNLNQNVLKTIVISDGVTTIGNDAFKNCTSLTKIYIPSTVTSIATDAFYYSVGSSLGKNQYARQLKISFVYDDNNSVKFVYSGKILLGFESWGKRYYTTDDILKNSISDVNSYMIDIIKGFI